ncbi:MAG: hypothetical protein HY898_10390 [Deltaproteobacteria bacterium]|nr:hypothetical protein [Deltaproteobacteria bacterium]
MLVAAGLGCGGDPHAEVQPISSDAAAEAASFTPLAPVSQERRCPKALADAWGIGSQVLELDVTTAANVRLAPGLLTKSAIIVPWTATPCCAPGATSVGVANLAPLNATKTVLLGSSNAGQNQPFPVFARGDELGALDPFQSFTRVVSVRADTLEIGASVPIDLHVASTSTPSVVAVGNAVAALLGPDPRLVMLDATLGEVLMDVPLGDGPVEGSSLTFTEAGLVATWIDGFAQELVAVAFDTMGEQRSAMQRYAWNSSTNMAPSVAWDGVSVVISGPGAVLELGVNAELVAQTPVVGEALAAAGADDGVVALTSKSGSSEDPHIQLLERGTGKLLEDLGAVEVNGYGVTGSVVAARRTLFFATSSYSTRSQVVWRQVDCGP